MAQATNIKKIKYQIEAYKTIVEIAGPSPLGYAFFKENNINVPKWQVTNIETPIVIDPYAEDPLTTEVDVVNTRKMPYKNESVDMFIESYLSICSDLWLKIPTLYLRTHIGALISNYAEHEYKRKNVKKRLNLHIAFLIEAYRCLKPGGLVLMVGYWQEDKIVARKLGFTVILDDYIAKDGSETIILQKT